MRARVAAALDRLANAQRRLVQDVATRHGLSPLQVQIVGLLSTDGPPSPRGSAVSRELGVSQPTVSDAVAALRAKGLVERTPDAVDRRVSALALTDAGREVADKLRTATGVVTGAIHQLPEGQQEEALLALLRLISVLVDADVVGVARTCLTCRFHQQRAGVDHCTLLGTDLPVRALRVNCPEHQPSRPATTAARQL